MEAAQPADCHNLAVRQALRGSLQRGRPSAHLRAVSRLFQPHARTAVGTAVGLRVVAPIGGLAVLPQALVALRERPHARALPVVGHRLDDREPGAAIGAGDERIVVAPVGRIEQLGFADRAQRHVGRYRLAPVRLVHALDDAELVHVAQLGLRDVDRVDARQRWGLGHEVVHECLHRRLAALDRYPDLAGFVAHPAAEPVLQRQAVHEGTEAHPLHHPRDAESQGFALGGGGAGGHARLASATCPSRKAYHSSSPSPVRAEVKKNERSGFTSSAWALAFSISNVRCGSRSILVNTA